MLPLPLRPAHNSARVKSSSRAWHSTNRGVVRTLGITCQASRQPLQLQIVFVSPEVSPWNKVGGLGDVAAGLPAALAKRGHKIMTVTPRYSSYQDAAYTGISAPVTVCSDTLFESQDHFNSSVSFVQYYVCRMHGVDTVFVHHPLFAKSKPGTSYVRPGQDPVVAAQYSILCQAALAAPTLLWSRAGEAQIHDKTYIGAGWQLVYGIAKPLRSTAGQPMRHKEPGEHANQSAIAPIFVGNDWPCSLLGLWLKSYVYSSRLRPQDCTSGQKGQVASVADLQSLLGRSELQVHAHLAFDHASGGVSNCQTTDAPCISAGLAVPHDQIRDQDIIPPAQEVHTSYDAWLLKYANGPILYADKQRSIHANVHASILHEHASTSPIVLEASGAHSGKSPKDTHTSAPCHSGIADWPSAGGKNGRIGANSQCGGILTQPMVHVSYTGGLGIQPGTKPTDLPVVSNQLDAPCQSAHFGEEALTNPSVAIHSEASEQSVGSQGLKGFTFQEQEGLSSAQGLAMQNCLDFGGVEGVVPRQPDGLGGTTGLTVPPPAAAVPGAAARVSPGSCPGAQANAPSPGRATDPQELLRSLQAQLGEQLQQSKVAFVVHNAAYQGIFDRASFAATGLPQHWLRLFLPPEPTSGVQPPHPGAAVGQDTLTKHAGQPSSWLDSPRAKLASIFQALGKVAQQLLKQLPLSLGGAAPANAVASGLAASGDWEGLPQDLNWMRAAVLSSDLVVTVSQVYAEQLRSGVDVAPDMRDAMIESGLLGITNGIDTSSWDPATDKFLPPVVRFRRGVDTAASKQAAKAFLQSRVGLDVDPSAPLFVFIGRLTEEKGSDVMLAALPSILGAPLAPGRPLFGSAISVHKASGSTRPERPRGKASSSIEQECSASAGSAGSGSGLFDSAGVTANAGSDSSPTAQRCQLAMLGVGQRWQERCVTQLEQVYPGRAVGFVMFNEALAHLLLAAADFAVVPSRTEPCGLIALCAMRYGAVPVVSCVGGLKELVGEEEGLLVRPPGPMADPSALRQAVLELSQVLSTAVAEYGDEGYRRRQAAGMSRDVSWTGPAAEWEALLTMLSQTQ